jgi:hypothetical protein
MEKTDDQIFNKKIQNLVITTTNAKDDNNNKLLNKIARKRCKPKNLFHKERYLHIAQQLLLHGAHPDFCLKPDDPTALMIAACNNDKPYAQSLIWHNADPHKKGIWLDSSLKNSFEIEKEKNVFEMEPTGWLQQMVDKKKTIIFNYLLFKHHTISEECIFPIELVQLIIHIIGQIYKKYNDT